LWDADSTNAAIGFDCESKNQSVATFSLLVPVVCPVLPAVGPEPCILCARGLANGVARAGLRGGSTHNQDSAACEKELFRVHLLLLGLRRWNEDAPSADPAQTRNGPVRRKFRAGKAQFRYSSIKRFLFASQP
jgi:hypothetical protein